MKAFNNCLVILELLFIQLYSAGSYTVVLKQVKPLHPSVKVYRYELRHPKIFPESNTQYIYHRPLLGQRIYPVAIKPGREGNFKTRVPVKKEKGQNYKISPTEKPALKDPRLIGLSQSLVPPVSNQLEEYSEAREDENDVRSLPATFHTGKSFSSFGQEKGRIYSNPGVWATPTPQANPENTTSAEFTPSQLYLQIRHKNTVIHVPQSEALKDAETLEELINAPRLKELSRTTHVQETYSEEGYEDAGYDHAGHIRQAQHGEVYNAKDEGKFKIKEPPIILDYDSDLEESKEVPLKETNIKKNISAEENSDNKLEPRITRSRSEISKTSVEYAKTPKNYKGDHKYSSKVKSPLTITDEDKNNFNATTLKELPSIETTFPSYFGEMPPTLESTLANDSIMPYKSSGKKSSKYRKSDLNSTKIYPVSQLNSTNAPLQINEYIDFNPYISMIDSQASPSAKSLKYSRIYSKKTKQLRLEPYKNENIYSPPPPSPVSLELLPQDILPPPRITEEEEPINERIVLPTIGYINSLTTAHFGKGNSKPLQDESKPQLTGALNLTQALNYLRINKNQQNFETSKNFENPSSNSTEFDIRTFEPMKLKAFRPDSRSFVNKIKRDVRLVRKQGKMSGKKAQEYEGNDESDLPHDEKNEEIAEDERKRLEDENREKEKYEAELKQEISNQEKEIIKETFRNIGVEKDVSDVFPESSFSDSELETSSFPVETTPKPVNFKKYPFYMSKKLPENSPLRYATDPRQFPKKSGYKMEFYESRERLIQCPDFYPDLGNLSHSNSTGHSDERPKENPRIGRLGDKITCLRMKYFDPEPFDNPIFKEKEIDYVGKQIRHQKKILTHITPKAVKKDQKFHQMSHPESYVTEPNRVFNTVANISQLQVDQFQSNESLKPYLFGQPTTFLRPNATEKDRVIPVTEVLNDFPSYSAYSASAVQDRAPQNLIIGWKTIYHSQDRVRDPQKSLETKNQINTPQNCLPLIKKMTVLDGAKNLTVNCKDVILIQEIINNAARLKIIPKQGNKGKEVKYKWNRKIPTRQSFGQTDWIPIVGYRLPKHLGNSLQPLSRRTDEVSQLKNETSQNNSSAHYVIDELKEDENVRKGEVVEDMSHYLKLIEDLKDEMTESTTFKVELKTENSTRKRREAQNNFEKLKKQSNFAKRLEFSFDKSRQIQTSTKNETEKSFEGPNPETSKPFEMKRPLKRLSGIDFLIRYHKNKHKPTAQKTEDFWKVAPVNDRNVQKVQKKNSDAQKPLQTIFKKNGDKSDKTTPLQSIAETTTLKDATEVRKYQTNSSTERRNKSKSKQTNGTKKISPLNLTPEKVTEKPESKPPEFWKGPTQSAVLEKASTKPLNFTKIITKVSRETSESSEKTRIIYKQGSSTNSGQNSSTESPAVPNTSSVKPETPQHKTLNRNLIFSRNDSDHSNTSTESPEGPILYYVINLKTGRGKWIRNYNEQSRGSSGKYRKFQKLKESSGIKREKTLRRKKLKY